MNDRAPTSRPSREALVLSVLGLAAFLAFEALLLRHYVRVDTRPPSWDQSTHMEIALDYREALGAGRWSDFWYLAPKPGMPPFPPAYHLLLRGAYDSPDPAHAALWLNWWYMTVLAVSLFAVAWRFQPDTRALAATLIFCAAPGIQDLLTTQLVDLALVAWVAAGYWALLASEGFTYWFPALLFAILHAVGMLHKWSYFSYMFPAYFVAARALADRRARLKVLATGALSLALFAPWYWAHLALLPTRLVQASSDFAVPFWKDAAWAEYLRQSCGALGPAAWLLGFIGLLAIPRYSRRGYQGGVIIGWVVASYLFWMVVPNRQIRFLLPGLAPLGLTLAAVWPRPLTWAVALLQVFGMANFFFGAVPPITAPTPLIALSFFESRPPAREDWKIEEILRRIEADRDPTRPLTNVTLVANDAFFNGPTFHWAQRYLHLPHARMRGVNKRLSEFSEFVLLKDGRLGPEGVIGGLPEAAAVIADPHGWFTAAYEPLARWPLPDGSAAVLFRQRRDRPKPIPGRRLACPAFAIGDVAVKGLRAELGAWDAGLTAWKTARVGVDQIDARGLAVRDAKADLGNFSVANLSDCNWDTARLMRLDRVTVRGLEIDAPDLKAFLEKRIPRLQIDSLVLDGTVKVAGRWAGRPVAAEAALDLDRAAHRLKIRVISASFLDAQIPVSLFRPIKELDVSLEPNPETPFFIDLPGLTIKGGRLTVP